MPSGFWSPGLIGWARCSSCCSHSLLGNLGRGQFLRVLWSWTCMELWKRGKKQNQKRQRQKQTETDEQTDGRGERYKWRKKWRERHFLLNIHLRSFIGHHLLQAIINSVLSLWWHIRLNIINITAEHTLLNSVLCCHKPVNHLGVILILTNAYWDVCRPLIVVLAGNCFLSNQFEAKLALKS